MKALTIKQPWASLIMEFGKDVDNRTWKTNYRGPLVIHAGKQFDCSAAPMRLRLPTGARWMDGDKMKAQSPYFPAGSCLGIADVVECTMIQTSPWHDTGLWGWYLANVRPFPQPVPYKGTQGLWNIPDEEVDAMLMGAEKKI